MCACMGFLFLLLPIYIFFFVQEVSALSEKRSISAPGLSVLLLNPCCLLSPA